MARGSWVVTGFVSSAIGRRARRSRDLQFRQLSLPKWAVRQLGVRDDELRLVQHPFAEAHDVQVQGAWPPAQAPPALAAAPPSDRVQVDDQLDGPAAALVAPPLA